MRILKTAKFHGIPAAKSAKRRRLEVAEGKPNHWTDDVNHLTEYWSHDMKLV
jgi:hypothetical protein